LEVSYLESGKEKEEKTFGGVAIQHRKKRVPRSAALIISRTPEAFENIYMSFLRLSYIKFLVFVAKRMD